MFRKTQSPTVILQNIQPKEETSMFQHYLALRSGKLGSEWRVCAAN
jgi:hypothetical protein